MLFFHDLFIESDEEKIMSFWLVPTLLFIVPYAILAIGIVCTPWPLQTWKDWEDHE
jgi:hypothetical protein